MNNFSQKYCDVLSFSNPRRKYKITFLKMIKEEYIKYVAYIILIGGVLFAWRTEHRDINCPDLNNSTKEECEEGGGMSFAWSKPKVTDTCEQLLEKIHKAAGAEVNTVKWRKALVISAAIMCIMWVLVGVNKNYQGFPDWRMLYLSICISFIILLSSYLYYSCHFSEKPQNWIRESLKMLKAKGCINAIK